MGAVWFNKNSEASMITNLYEPEAARPRLPAEEVFLYRPAEGWTYSHHQSLTFFKGRFYAIWSNGRRDEDAPGQRVLCATSEDFYRWTDPYPMVNVMQGKHSERVLTAAGFHQQAGTLVVYFGSYEYAEGVRPKVAQDHVDTCLFAMTSADGESWSAPTADVENRFRRELLI
jgi:hypothetical protein